MKISLGLELNGKIKHANLKVLANGALANAKHSRIPYYKIRIHE
ncbi:hypothetical protein [Winogradskyella forsetii]|nr:hypothetical protein [Winogradskyella forsetii]